MNLVKKYICELVFVINVFLIVPGHDYKIWWQRPIINDAFGYYVYLPAVFIYHNLSYDFMQEPIEKYYKEIANDKPKGAFVVNFKGKEVNKYPPGVAYFHTPFFLLAHLTAKITGRSADGYSNIYMYFMSLSAIFWQYIFLILLRKIFKFYSLSLDAHALTAVFLAFGTNLYFYTQHFGSYSHIYSLLSTSLFFYGGIRFFKDLNSPQAKKYFFIMCVGIALAIVVRNLNVLALLFLPVMGLKLKDVKHYFQISKSKTGITALLVSSAVVFSMLLFWKLQSGYWLIDSYPDEHFYWTQPQILKSLFSVHKGWFFYTPIALIALFGFLFAPRKIAFNFLAIMALIIYVVSSWGTWDYGTGFSMRAYIDWYLIISLGFGFLFNHLLTKKTIFYPILCLCILLSAINLLQSVQFMRGIISGQSQGMEYTIKNFFRIRPILEYQIAEEVTEAKVRISEDFNSDKQQQFTFCNEKMPFSKALQVKFEDYLGKDKYTHFRFGGTIKLANLNNGVLLCVSITNEKDSMIYWQQRQINDFVKANTEEKVESGMQVQSDFPSNAKCSVFFWEPKGNTECKIDDLYFEFIKARYE